MHRTAQHHLIHQPLLHALPGGNMRRPFTPPTLHHAVVRRHVVVGLDGMSDPQFAVGFLHQHCQDDARIDGGLRVCVQDCRFYLVCFRRVGVLGVDGGAVHFEEAVEGGPVGRGVDLLVAFGGAWVWVFPFLGLAGAGCVGGSLG